MKKFTFLCLVFLSQSVFSDSNTKSDSNSLAELLLDRIDTILDRPKDDGLTVEEQCAITKLEVTQQHAKCLTDAQIEGINKSLPRDELDERLAACQSKHAEDFEKAEMDAESMGGVCWTTGDAPAIHTGLSLSTTAPTSCGTSGPYVDNCDGTITDTRNGLMWEKKLAADGSLGGNCPEKEQKDRLARCVNNRYSWSIANCSNDTKDCLFNGTAKTEFLNRLNNRCMIARTVDCSVNGDSDCSGSDVCGFAGHRDWRLPSVTLSDGKVVGEALTILDRNEGECAGNSGACIDPVFGPTEFVNDPPRLPIYWTSSDEGGTTTAWSVDFSNGNTPPAGKTLETPVRAVRGP